MQSLLKALLCCLTPLLLIPASLAACSCVGDYLSLEERLCQLKAEGGVAVEVTLVSKEADGFARVSVDGTSPSIPERRRLVLDYAIRWTCGYSLESDRLGQRYLLLLDSVRLGQDTVELWECYYRSNIYRLSRSGDQIEYEIPDQTDPERRAGLGFQSYDRQWLRYCPEAGDARPLVKPSPLRSIGIAGNPGNGYIRLVDAAGSLPPLVSLRVFGADGRQWADIDLAGYRGGETLDLTALPPGFYHLSVFTDTHYRTLAYVRGG